MSETAAVPLPAPGQRRRIWQIDAHMHCSVLGTCLSLKDLHAIGRRARYPIDASLPAYHLHSWFVDMMCSPNELSKLTDKALEKRYARVAQQVRRARTEEELEAHWKEATGGGHIAGAYWGAVSHPLCSSDLQWKFFGEIHMLSHLVGASRQSDLTRLHDLEGACAVLDAKLAQLKHDHRGTLKDRKKLEDELTAKARDLEGSERRLTLAQRRIALLESQRRERELETRLPELEQLLQQAEERVATAEASLSNREALIEEMRNAGIRAAEQLQELTAENEALEAELGASFVCPLVSTQDGVSAEDDGALCGKRILCVGGRVGLVQHYRALVERRGGEFLHHDGGLEDSLDAVTRALSTVDAVVCPVDCVSHAACLKVKRACKHLAKQFVPLRSSGLSSFARGIQAIARPRTQPSELIATIGTKP